jgi:hypothetical protein
MGRDRFVLLGLAPARSGWFDAVARWTTSASIAAEFVKCVSGAEARARLVSGRRYSALLVDVASPAFDRDLVDLCRSSDTPVLLVRNSRGPNVDAAEVGATAELAADFSPDDLLETLAAHCRPVSEGTSMPPLLDETDATAFWQAPLFAVCGSGGTGASTVAIAIACGLARHSEYAGRVVLADLARRADQAMLHDSLNLGPGIQELVESHRLGRPGPDEILRTTFEVPRRGYQLLLGLRQPEAWTTMRPRYVDAALAGLRRSFQAVVADITGDFEGEADGGSIEVEERNHLARAAAGQATVCVAVGAPGMKGVHSLASTISRMVKAGVEAHRVVAVINRSPRHPRARAESSRALATLLADAGTVPALAGPVHLPERKLEEVLRDGSSLPGALVDPITKAVRLVADRVADAAPPESGPTRIVPGALGRWADGEGVEA